MKPMNMKVLRFSPNPSLAEIVCVALGNSENKIILNHITLLVNSLKND